MLTRYMRFIHGQTGTAPGPRARAAALAVPARAPEPQPRYGHLIGDVSGAAFLLSRRPLVTAGPSASDLAEGVIIAGQQMRGELDATTKKGRKALARLSKIAKTGKRKSDDDSDDPALDDDDADETEEGYVRTDPKKKAPSKRKTKDADDDSDDEADDDDDTKARRAGPVSVPSVKGRGRGVARKLAAQIIAAGRRARGQR